MKRLRLDPDPVYPFGTSETIPMPPFIEAGSGLAVNGLQLYITAQAPVGFTNKAVTLKYGDGLEVNENGELIATASSAVKPPLHFDRGYIVLNLQDPLGVIDGKLGVKLGPGVHINGEGAVAVESPVDPITLDTAGRITLNYGTGLNVSDGKLRLVSPESPLTLLGNGKVALNFGNSMELVQGTLQLKAPLNPLFMTPAGAIGLRVDDMFNISEGLLSFKMPSDPISFNADGMLSLNTNDTLQTTGGLLGLTEPAKPLKLADGKLGVNVGLGLAVSNGSLTVNAGQGLTIRNNAVAVNGGNTLAFNNYGEVELKNPRNPISLTQDGELALIIGDGLTTLDGRLTLLTASTSPIAVGPTGVTFNVTPSDFYFLSSKLALNVETRGGLEKSDTGLKIKRAAPLSITSDGELTLAYDSTDFQVTENGLALKVSPTQTPLTRIISMGNNLFDSGYEIFASCPQNKAAKVAGYVYLTSVGGLVHGTIQIKATAGYWFTGGNSVQESIRFGLVLCPFSARDPTANLSGWPAPVVWSGDSNTPLYFAANAISYTNNRVNLAVTGNFYKEETELPGYTRHSFCPTGTTGMNFTGGNLYVCPCTVNTGATTLNAIYMVFVITQSTLGTNFFASNTPPNTFFLTPPIPFTYVGAQ
ncbi:fiber protein [Duck adenovirus 1]|nr:fiber protein [Duck adenovirus 1]